MSSTSPPLLTRADGAAASRKASSAFSPRYSVSTPAPTIGARITRTSRPSRTSLRAMARQPAIKSSTTKGSRAPSHKSRRSDVFCVGSSSFGPNSARRTEVCSGVRPRAGSVPSRSRTASAESWAAVPDKSNEGSAERGRALLERRGWRSGAEAFMATQREIEPGPLLGCHACGRPPRRRL